MNMNSKNQDHYGGDYNKRFNRATMVEIITKEISRATMEEIITKEISRATNNRFNQGHYGGNIEQ